MESNMTSRALIPAIAMCCIVAACGKESQPPTPGASAKCTTAECKVAVHVSGTPPAVSAMPPILPIDANNHGPNNQGVRIIWHIVENGYKFQDDGIQFKGANVGSAPTQFDQPGAGGDGKEFHYRDKNTDNKTYDYKITVHDANGNAIASDPSIVNGAN
jgi:hypothetical protein